MSNLIISKSISGCESETNESSVVCLSENENKRLNLQSRDELLRLIFQQPLSEEDLQVQKKLKVSCRIDEKNYASCWYYYNVQRERSMKPLVMFFWNTGWELLRVKSIASYWRSTISHRISPITVHIAVGIVNRVLSEKRVTLLTRNWFALVIVSALRIAVKFEERPDTLWYISQMWQLFPLFEAWDIDRDEKNLKVVENELLSILNNRMDIPLAIQYFDHYIKIGGWPADIAEEYTNLGHYLLAMFTFSSTSKQGCLNFPPSMIGMAALVLTIKIINANKTVKRYEILPLKLQNYTGFNIKSLQPATRVLSCLLRNKPHDSHILTQIYPEWGCQEWR